MIWTVLAEGRVTNCDMLLYETSSLLLCLAVIV